METCDPVYCINVKFSSLGKAVGCKTVNRNVSYDSKYTFTTLLFYSLKGVSSLFTLQKQVCDLGVYL